MKELFSRVSKQRAQRFEHRIISFDSPKTLDTLPARNAEIWRPGCLLLEHVHERGLAYARFTGNEHNLPLAAQCSL